MCQLLFVLNTLRLKFATTYLFCVAMFLFAGPAVGAVELNSTFGISNMASADATSCSAADGTITLTIDPANQGVSPYDVSLDNGTTWVESNLTPTAGGELSVTNQTWGTYAIAVRDASGYVIYPGYVQIAGCSINVGAFSNPTFSTASVSGATGYTWTTTIGAITAGQNTVSATFDFSGEVHSATGTICAQPTGPTCTAPPTCFDFTVVATYNIEGSVFEDVNYGGGAGRNLGVANTSAVASGWTHLDIGIENCWVELYSDTGSFMEAVQTDVSGVYQFENIVAGDYTVRFVTRSANSNRATNGTGNTAYAVPVFRSIGTSVFANEIGGVDPSKEDALANTTNSNISSLTSGSTVAQSITNVSLTSASVVGVDLGLSFNVVTNINNGGIGSLRQFILNSNELANLNIDQENNPSSRPVLAKAAGEDVSIFEIPGAGPHTISLSEFLPDLEDEFTHLTGYTQQGSVQGSPQVRSITIGLDGLTESFDGLKLDANHLTVSGLSLSNFDRGIEMISSGLSNLHVWGNYVGLMTDGISSGSNSNTGIYAQFQTNIVIGTDGDGLNDLSEGNVVGYSYEGINLRQTSNALVAGNYVGVDKTGSASARNRFHGIYLRECTVRNVVGLDDNISTLTLVAARNVSSGNGTEGIRLFASSNQVIAGNYIGTDRLGLSGIQNGGYGIQFVSEVNFNQIGTDSDGLKDDEERNVISGNNAGLRFIVGSSGTNNWIAGNYIGVDATGNAALPNNNNGAVFDGAQTNTILGTDGDGMGDANEGNVISGNLDDGIRVGNSNGLLISGNYIGVGADPLVAIPNEGRGIFVTGSASNITVGYSQSFTNTNPQEVGNIIRHNGDTGIALSGTGSNNRMSRNLYGYNSSLGIDLNYDLVTPNDNNTSGLNASLNYPVITYATLSETLLKVHGFAPPGVSVEFYIADPGPTPSPLPSGYSSSFGEGYMYLTEVAEGSASDLKATTGTYVDDGTGSTITKTENEFSFEIPVGSLFTSLSIGDRLTAISIDATGNTSEFGGVASVRFQEICDDLIDNDGDGLIDCDDDDCPNVDAVQRVAN